MRWTTSALSLDKASTFLMSLSAILATVAVIGIPLALLWGNRP